MGNAGSVPRSNSSLLRTHSRSSFSRLILESEAALGNYHTGAVFRCLQLIIMCLRMITPLSYLLLAIFFLSGSSIPDNPLQRSLCYLVLTFCGAEAVFFPYQVYKFHNLSNFNPDLEHYAKDWAGRTAFFHKCFDAMKIAASGITQYRTAGRGNLYLKKSLEEWFFGTPLLRIQRDNYAQWTSWAFFHKELEDLQSNERSEVEQLVDMFEEKLQYKFELGRNEETQCARLNLDPVFATQRPFAVYASIFAANLGSHLAIRWLGFEKLSEFSTPSQNMYCRLASLSPDSSTSSTRRDDPTEDFAGSMQGGDNTSKSSSSTSKKLPVVFFHGIGIGFAAYLQLISSLPRDVDIFMVEWPHVSMQMSAMVPSIQETKDIVAGVLDKHRHNQACFVGHSLGTTAISWMLRDARYAHLVATSILLDPVTFLLCDPTVATSFVYKHPRNVVDLGMHYFASRELYISQAISRHFSWSHNILFAEELQFPESIQNKRFCNDDQLRHTIILSSHDGLVPIGPVSRYLEIKKEEFQQQGKDCFELLMFHGYHGEMMLYPTWIKIISNRIKKRCVIVSVD